MKAFLTLIITLLIVSTGKSQIDTVTSFTTVIKPIHNISLENALFDEGSIMTYDSSSVMIDSNGAAFSIDYINQDGGNNFDGYPSGSIGGVKKSGVYYPGNYSASGMPVQLQSLAHDFRLKWKPFQINADDVDDKWWATINVIFDIGAANLEPVSTERDFDIVIQFQRYEQDALTDNSNTGGAYWWFARDSNGNIKPFTLMIEGVEYQWAIRYKFFNYPSGHNSEHKNNKVHIKFIPIDNNHIPLELDHPLKRFVDATVEYLLYVDLPAAELNLANQKVANPNLWVKKVSAGFEVYSGNSTLGQDYFYTIVDNIMPNAPTNLTITLLANSFVLNWDTHPTDTYESYTVYRSENGGQFKKLDSLVYTNTFEDLTVVNGVDYEYHITVLDRSFNESSPSNTVNKTILSINNHSNNDVSIYPNPTSNTVKLVGKIEFLGDISIYNNLGQNITELSNISKLSNNMIIVDLSKLDSGLYYIKTKTTANKVYKQ
jgi:hypothetical protein